MLVPASVASGTGEVVVQYERQLSPGIIGSIWLGRLASGSETGRLVSIRRIPRELLSADDVERVRIGAGACARLRSPAIVKLLGVAELDGELITVSEYLAGIRLIDLERCLIESEVTLPVGVATRLILDVARASVSARRLMMDSGVLAPNRVVVSDSALIALFGEVLLTDVGVMSALLRSPRVAQLPGVAADLSPEEHGLNTSISGSPEVYTLGVAFWQLLTNRWIQLPQGGPRGFVDAAARQSIPPVDSVERMGLPVPEPVARILRRATHRDPRKRFTSLDALVDALEQLPSNLVATSRQLQGFIQQTATQLMPECEASATWSTPARFSVSQPPPSRPVTLHPNGGHDWEPPTFAERRLVAPVVASSAPSEIELVDGPLAVYSIEPHKASRFRMLSLVFGAALAIVVTTLALARLAQNRGGVEARPYVQSRDARASAPRTALQPGAMATSALSADLSQRNANAQPPEDQDQTNVESMPHDARDSTTHANSAPKSEKRRLVPSASDSPDRPRKIAPYRPKGI